jgi:hypothetical protein
MGNEAESREWLAEWTFFNCLVGMHSRVRWAANKLLLAAIRTLNKWKQEEAVDANTNGSGSGAVLPSATTLAGRKERHTSASAVAAATTAASVSASAATNGRSCTSKETLELRICKLLRNESELLEDSEVGPISGNPVNPVLGLLGMLDVCDSRWGTVSGFSSGKKPISLSFVQETMMPAIGASGGSQGSQSTLAILDEAIENVLDVFQLA